LTTNEGVEKKRVRTVRICAWI